MSSMDPSPMVSDVQDGYKRVKQGVNTITYFSVIFTSPQISGVKITTSSNVKILLMYVGRNFSTLIAMSPKNVI